MSTEQMIQEGIRNILKQKVSELICPEHNKKAKINFEDNPYTLDCCCASFRDSVLEAIKP